MADEQQHDPITQMAADPDFAKLSLAQQRTALAAHDSAFSSLNDDQLTRFVKTHQGGASTPDATAQAQEVIKNIPQFTSKEDELRANLANAQSGAGKLGENYNDYMKQSGVFAGTAAGTMAGGATAAGPGILKLATRALATGAGAGVGSAAGGASPQEALETGATAAVSQPIAEGLGAVASKFAAPKAAAPITEEWQRINSALGVKANAIRIGENATSLESAATMPGRALAKAGLTSDQLAKMTPLERQAAIQPIRSRAATELDAGFKAATDAGTTFDVGKSAMPIFKKIINPKAGVDLQQQAIDTFNSLAEEAGITNQRAATPQQARTLRQLLSGGARFQQGGDLGTLNSIRAELYRGVNRDLHEAVPGLQDLDQFYSDVKGASIAARNSVAKMATKPPEPTFTQKTLDMAKTEALPWALRGAIGTGVGSALYKYAIKPFLEGNP